MGKITTVNKNERFPVVHLDPYHPFIEHLLSAREVSMTFSTIGALGYQDIIHKTHEIDTKELQKLLVLKLMERNPFEDLTTTTGKKVVANTMKWGSLVIRVSDGYSLTRRIEFKIQYSPKRKLHTIHLALPVLDIDLSEEGLVERYFGLMTDIISEAKDINLHENQYEKSAKLWESLPTHSSNEMHEKLNKVYFKLKSFINRAKATWQAEMEVGLDDFTIIHDLLEPFMIYGNKPYNPMFRGHENVPLTWWITLAHGQLNYTWPDGGPAIFTLSKGVE